MLKGLNTIEITKKSWINDSMLDISNIIVYIYNYPCNGCAVIPLSNLSHNDLYDFETAIHSINKTMSLALSYSIDADSMCLVFGNRALNLAIRNYALVRFEEQALVDEATSLIEQRKSCKKLSDFASELKLIGLLSEGTAITVMGNEADYDNFSITGIVRDVVGNDLVLEDIIRLVS